MRVASVAADVENALGGNVTKQQIEQTQIKRYVGDLGNLLNLVALGGAGKALATSVGAVGKSLLENTAA